MNSEILNTREAALYVRLGKQTIERFRITGEGPTYCKLGGSVRYRRVDLDAWLESRLTASTSAADGFNAAPNSNEFENKQRATRLTASRPEGAKS